MGYAGATMDIQEQPWGYQEQPWGYAGATMGVCRINRGGLKEQPWGYAGTTMGVSRSSHGGMQEQPECMQKQLLVCAEAAMGLCRNRAASHGDMLSV